MRVVAIVVSLAITAVAVALAVKAVRDMVAVIRKGQPAIGRTDNKGARWANMFKETLGHTRMLQWQWIGIMHWFVFAGFIFLSSMVLGAYFQVFDAHQALPIIGHWVVYEWPAEVLSWLTLIGIVYLIAVRQKNHPRSLGRKSRFFGSTFWQAYFVETIIFVVVLCGFTLRTLEYAMEKAHGADDLTFHYPLTFFLGDLWDGLSVDTMETLVYTIAMIKIVVSMTWLITIARNITMGVAWHRFTAWFNIWFKRESDGSTALGGLEPIYIKGKALDLEDMDDLEEEDFAKLGVGKVEDFTWKGILDFTTCTECGRCQSQCPAWNTEKPLSPKLLMMGLRDHAYAKLPILGQDEETLTDEQKTELERPLIGNAEAYGVIDPDVLWSCTNCGACVQQCPVDIEHVDHIDDMRRFQVLVESNFPAELNNIFKGLERKGNPWGMDPKGRMDWAKKLDFEVKQVGVDVEDLDEVEWLFWVGCAGAFEDRAKKTTQAVAELLDMAGVTFAVLGDGETCTGDPARRAGNEIVFQQLAMQNAEVFKETKVKKVVSTCAHCFNTLKNEYAEFGVELEVVHHTQLLNRLVREGKLTPVAPTAETETKKITYHDPCFLGRHNQVYEPPRELLSVIPGAEFTEMPRNSEKSFCCGAGGARMWMEETLGSRINVNRTEEAIATGADQIAVGCPFCRVMLSDGLTLKQSEGAAREEVEVLDVAQMLLAGVKRAPSAEETAAVVAEAEAATSAEAEAATESPAGPSSGSGGPDEVTDTDKAAAAASNIDVDDAGSRTGDAPEARSDETAPPAPEPVKAEAPDSEAKADPAEEAEPDAEDKADESISRTEDVGPAAEATATEDESTPVEPVETTTEASTGSTSDDSASDAEPADDRDASEKEKAAWANVGPVNTDLTPDSSGKDPGDTTDPETESVPEESDSEPEIPATKTPDESPAEEVTHVPDETEPVEEDAREEEAGIIPVEDAESTADPVSDDAAPLSDANPSGADLSKAAGGATDEAADEADGETKS
ncbi:heterodisulfide reductase-related iron-sulfur binding cluster [Aeromicrobium sp. 9AM]|uniref:heterodisulfide reductase-related iron-sulfur binding cluster n=1 Tax=Aeromicrobium sp. 9AM TaxID=2653126 RepID=UPI0012EFD3D8|nr:heterodisulfide reductase-related iron-sulfur binding cluster [Aeromicrobium sp. 9AM]VXC41810.1 Fe-S cluster protein [Aeromicrobium sp. 9AM]